MIRIFQIHISKGHNKSIKQLVIKDVIAVSSDDEFFIFVWDLKVRTFLRIFINNSRPKHKNSIWKDIPIGYHVSRFQMDSVSVLHLILLSKSGIFKLKKNPFFLRIDFVRMGIVCRLWLDIPILGTVSHFFIYKWQHLPCSSGKVLNFRISWWYSQEMGNSSKISFNIN